MADFPDGAFDLYWAARYEQVVGNADRAVQLFEKSIKSQSELLQVHNMCRWDLLWVYAMRGDWKAAALNANLLVQDCAWSRATNMYQFACFQYMIMEEENRPELRPLVTESMRRVIELRTRYAGKTMPPEKFAIIKAQRYLDGEQEMVLPVYELFYIWNIFGNSRENFQILEPIVAHIERKMKEMKQHQRTSIGESIFVLLLLKGVCLRCMRRREEALVCFSEVLKNQDLIELESYVPPHAAFERGLTLLEMGCHEEAKLWLEKARDQYSGFLVESLVHLRIHGALTKLKELRN